MNKVLSSLKPYLRWLILGITLFFLVKALKNHWQEVLTIRITPAGGVTLAIAYLLSLLAYTWSAWVWSWILQSFQQSINSSWMILVYLKTNLAKYLPGNIWHYYGRILAVTKAGGSIEAATISVLLELPLMAAAALLITVMGSQQANWYLQILSLGIILFSIHPRILNPMMRLLSKIKKKSTGVITEKNNNIQIVHYPLFPLLGEMGFLGLRGMGFLCTFMAITPINLLQIPLLLSTFSFAWLMGVIVPGAPGGLGVFEATAIAMLSQKFSIGIIFSVVALFRVVTILAEISVAGIATLITEICK